MNKHSKLLLSGGMVVTTIITLCVKQLRKEVVEFNQAYENLLADNTVQLDETIVEEVNQHNCEPVILQEKTMYDAYDYYADELDETEDSYEDEIQEQEEFSQCRLELFIHHNKKEGFEMLYPSDSQEALTQYNNKMVARLTGATRDRVLELFEVPLVQHNSEDNASYQNCEDIRANFFGDGPFIDPTFGDLFMYYVDRSYFDYCDNSRQDYATEFIYNLGLAGDGYTTEDIFTSAAYCMQHKVWEGSKRGLFGLTNMVQPKSFNAQYYMYLNELESRSEKEYNDEVGYMDYNDDMEEEWETK